MPASLELVRIALQAYGNGDSEIALALADPLIRWDERASRPDGELVWGHDDVGKAMRLYLDSWEEYRFDLEDIAEVAPGKIVGICRERGRANGVPVDRRFGGLWVVEEGRIVSWSTYLTPKEAVRAAKELAGGELQPPKPKAAAPGKVAVRQDAPVKQEAPTKHRGPAEDAVPAPQEAPVKQDEPVKTESTAKTRKPKPASPSEEKRRAAKARAKLRKRASKQTA